MHTKGGRNSQDLDFVTKTPLSDEELLSKGYKKSITGKQPWFSPRGIKIDIFTGNIPGVAFDWIVKNSKKFPVGKNGNVWVLGLESFVAAKYNAARDQDIEDLRNIVRNKLEEIDWNLVRQITGDQFMTDNIRRDMELLSKNLG